MEFYDVTQEVFSSKVYPGDPVPGFERIQSVKGGDECNLTEVKMCAHNGTHMDAPRHFFDSGRAVDEICPEQFMGKCMVFEYSGVLGGEDVLALLKDAGTDKVLLKGELVVTEEAARAFAESGVRLLGVEGQTVGSDDITQKVHKILLGADMVIVEGLVLSGVEAGEYFAAALPLKLAGCDGAPCRVVLVR